MRQSAIRRSGACGKCPVPGRAFGAAIAILPFDLAPLRTWIADPDIDHLMGLNPKARNCGARLEPLAVPSLGMRMTATFTKAAGVPALYRWSDGVVAETMPNSGLRFPHDLGHWLLECQVPMPYGFWSLAGQQAPFASFQLTAGRWPRGKAVWLDRVRRKHAGEMLHAEAKGGLWLAADDLDVHRDWKAIRRSLATAYAFTADSCLTHLSPHDVELMVPLARRTVAQWDALPLGDALEVTWPGTAEPISVPGSLERAMQ